MVRLLRSSAEKFSVANGNGKVPTYLGKSACFCDSPSLVHSRMDDDSTRPVMGTEHEHGSQTLGFRDKVLMNFNHYQLTHTVLPTSEGPE